MLKRSLQRRKSKKMIGITLAVVALSMMLLALTAGSVSQWHPGKGWAWGKYKPHPVIVKKPVVHHPALPQKNITKNTSEVNIGVDIDNTAVVDNSGFTVINDGGSGTSCGCLCGGCSGSGDFFNDLQDVGVTINQVSGVGIDVNVLQGNK